MFLRRSANVWVSDFLRVGRKFTIVKTIKLGVIFQKYELKLIKIWKTIEKILEKCKFFVKFLIIGRNIICNYRKLRNWIWAFYNGGTGVEPPQKVDNFFNKFVETDNEKYKFNSFQNFLEIVFCSALGKNIIRIENSLRPGAFESWDHNPCWMYGF